MVAANKQDNKNEIIMKIFHLTLRGYPNQLEKLKYHTKQLYFYKKNIFTRNNKDLALLDPHG